MQDLLHITIGDAIESMNKIFEKLMNTIKINGKLFSVSGNNVSINGNSVIVNGIKIVDGLKGVVKVEWVGEVADVQSDYDVQCGNVQGSVNAGMNVTCQNVGGDVDAGMNVKCSDVTGDVDAGMGVTIRK
mgnify:CR=1 FL=1